MSVEVYRVEFDKIAFEILSSKPLRSKVHVCQAINCTVETLERWTIEYDSFHDSVARGLIEGEVLFRNLLSRLAVRGSSKVNTKVLLTLAENVYGIGKSEIKIDIDLPETVEDIDDMSDDDVIREYRNIMKG